MKEITSTVPNTDLPPEARHLDWAARAEQLRQQEWDVAQKLIRLCRTLLNRWLSDRHAKATPADAARLLDVASKLGRLSSGLAAGQHEMSGSCGASFRIELEAALERIYGEESKAKLCSVSDTSSACPVPANQTLSDSQVPEQPPSLP